MLLLTLPVVYPAVIALGYDPIWFGIIVVKMCEVCLITPPVGLNCYVVHAVRPDIPLGDVFRGIGPFFGADVATLALFIAFPEIILWLPRFEGMGRITSYNVCYTKLLRPGNFWLPNQAVVSLV